MAPLVQLPTCKFDSQFRPATWTSTMDNIALGVCNQTLLVEVTSMIWHLISSIYYKNILV